MASNIKQTDILISGTGGQGILVMGQVLAYSATSENLNVLWLPSYGPETRGGTSDCSVIISSDEIGSPVICSPDVLVAMHQIAMDKYIQKIKQGGSLIFNSSLASSPHSRGLPKGVSVYAIPASEIAISLGDARVANLVMLGAFLGVTEMVGLETVKQSLENILPARHKQLLPLNLKALDAGFSVFKVSV